MSEPPGIPVWQAGRVFWQEGDDDENYLPEPALLVHVDNGGCLILQQEDRYITITRSARNLKALKAVLGAVFKDSKGDPDV